MDLTNLKISAALGFAAVLSSWCVALAAPTAPAVYTNAQAAQGGSVYASQCASCHGEQLEGNIGPAMKGPQFKQMVAAQQLTGASLLEVISQSMPKSTPGSLTATEYASIVAYILQQNGLPAGQTPLAPNDPQLANLSLSKLPQSN
jgi:mono/diheme cytochrome c family protein